MLYDSSIFIFVLPIIATLLPSIYCTLYTSPLTGNVDWKEYFVSENYCEAGVSGQTLTSSAYGAWLGPLIPVTVQNGMLVTHYPQLVNRTYSFEGSLINGSQCSFCPYSDFPQTVAPEYLAAGGIRSVPYPMYGPCFDGQPSTTQANMLSCVQDQILYPREVAGEYFYPNQVLSPSVGFPWFAHEFIDGNTPTQIMNVDANGNQIAPTNYALGKGEVLANLATFQIWNNGTTNTVNTTLTALIQSPYLTDPTTGNEGWVKWAQHFCRAGCHRNALIQTYYVKPSDYEGKPALSYLSRKMLQANGQPGPLWLNRCFQCPAYQAAYTWLVTTPADPRDLLITNDCYPWFGSVPLLTSTYRFGNVTTLLHSIDTDGVSTPSYNYEYAGVPCPVNTYNRQCAHYFKLMAIQLQDALQQPQCTPCPPGGFHTNGLTGAWFCLPPPGQTMLIVGAPSDVNWSPLMELFNLFMDERNMSLLWSRRDILGYEWECGTEPAHCYQCGDSTTPDSTGFTPTEFNEQIIVANLLVWQACPSGYYCPNALSTPPISCPHSMPWSPPGSAYLSNCTCARGTYLNHATQTCVACNVPSMCPPGQYLAGYLRCTQENGATSGGVCSPCTNAPALNATYVYSGATAGVEVMIIESGSSGEEIRYLGFCGFNCAQGTQLSTSSASSGGGSTSGNGATTTTTTATNVGSCQLSFWYVCMPVGMLYDHTGNVVYSPSFLNLYDGFRVLPTCSPLTALTNEINKMTSPSCGSDCCLLASTTCTQASPQVCPVGTVCQVVVNATYATNFVCAKCPAPPPNGAYNLSSMTFGLPFACTVTCATEFYFNSSSGTCNSCASLDALCGGGDMHMRGGGCYGSQSPLLYLTNLTMLKQSNCVKCDQTLANAPASSSYLDLEDTSNFCTWQPCIAPSGVGSTVYVVTPCGGTTNFVTASCIFSCPSPGQWLKGKCTYSSTGICVNCTNFKPGYYRISACGAAVDAQWQLCGTTTTSSSTTQFIPGFYCPGDGSQQACPNNKTSMPGAVSASTGCVCPAGTQPSIQNDGTCTAMHCPDAVALNSAVVNGAPSAGWKSAYYMTLSSDTLLTICQRCSSSSSSVSTASNTGIVTQEEAYTLGDGIGLASCQCPPNYYIVPDPQNLTTHVLCVACTSTTISTALMSSSSCTNGGSGAAIGYIGVPDICWTGLQQGASSCECIPPPYTRLTSPAASSVSTSSSPNTIATATSSCAASSTMCIPGFDLTSLVTVTGSTNTIPAAAGGVPDEPPTGSALYVSRGKSWTFFMGANSNDPQYYDYTIEHLAVTSDFGDGGWGAASNMQYAVWSIANGPLGLFAMALPPNTPVGYDPYNFLDEWTFITGENTCNTYFKCTIEGLAVAQWQTPQTTVRLSNSGTSKASSAPTSVAAVLMYYEPVSSTSGGSSSSSSNSNTVINNNVALNTYLWFYINTLQVSITSEWIAQWGAQSLAGVSFPVPANATVAGSVAHAYASPSPSSVAGSSSSSTFYVAVNAPMIVTSTGKGGGQQVTQTVMAGMVVAFSAGGGGGGTTTTGVPQVLNIQTASSTTSAIATPIAAMTVLAPTSSSSLSSGAGGGVWVYLALTTSSETLRLFRWSSTQSTQTAIVGSNNDEVFFQVATNVHALGILWPSISSLTPVFWALVETARSTDVSTAQAIFYPQGPPLKVQTADFIQRTFTDVQDMPYPTFPSLFSMTGIGQGTALLVAASGTSLFTLPASYCLPSSTGIPRYWDGSGTPMTHVCVRARSCDGTAGQVWSSSQLSCVCAPGYYEVAAASLQTLECVQCMTVLNVGYYCPGNGTRFACPTGMISPLGASSASQCTCQPGQYYSYSNSGGGATFGTSSCITCPRGSWCPNGWTQMICPGNVDLVRSTQGNVYPEGCVCAAGSVGANCQHCPVGFYCPAGISTMVVNNALLVSLAYNLDISSSSNTNSNNVDACAIMLASVIQPYFESVIPSASSTALLWYLKNPITLQQRWFCETVPTSITSTTTSGGSSSSSSGSGSSLITSNGLIMAVMIQTELGAQLNSVITNLPALIMNPNITGAVFAAYGLSIISISPPVLPSSLSIPNNTALQCSTNPPDKSPDATATTCICSAGYQTNGGTCSACPIGQFKAASGPGNCLICSIGSTTQGTASTACVSSSQSSGGASGNTSTTAGGSSSNNNIVIIAGSAVGGIIVVALLMYVVVNVL